MLRMVSKNVKEIVDQCKPNINVKIKYKQKVKEIDLNLNVMSTKYNFSSLTLWGCSNYCNKNNNLLKNIFFLR